jgi:Mn2+/Fe2+ NRAMP family transporter
MKRLLAVTLGILTAIGGFVDIGDLVTNALVGARFGMRLAWVVIVGVIGICLYAEMTGRVVALSGRPVFDLIRERLGPPTGLMTLIASFLVTLLTLIAEIGGIALAFELASGVNYLLWMPLAAVAVWLVIWRVKFSRLEQVFGLLGLLLIGFAVALWQLGPDWGELTHQANTPHPVGTESWATYAYYSIALFGAAMTPYEVFFFSSGGVEEKWTPRDLITARANVFVGFPLGGLLSLAIAGCAAVVFLPAGIQVGTLGQVALPAAVALGKLGLAVVLVGIFAATFGAAGDGAVVRIHDRAVPRLAVGQVGQPAGGVTLPSGDHHLSRARDPDTADSGRPGEGHGVLRGVRRDGAAVDLPTDPHHRQRPRLHGPADQRTGDQPLRPDVSGAVAGGILRGDSP